MEEQYEVNDELHHLEHVRFSGIKAGDFITWGTNTVAFKVLNVLDSEIEVYNNRGSEWREVESLQGYISIVTKKSACQFTRREDRKDEAIRERINKLEKTLKEGKGLIG